MEYVNVGVKNDTEYQTKTLIINPNGFERTLKVTFEYRDYVDKWYATIYDTKQDKCIASNIPLTASKNYVNDLFKQIRYMNIGSCWVAGTSSEYFGQDPTVDNIEEYEVIWGDKFENK